MMAEEQSNNHNNHSEDPEAMPAYKKDALNVVHFKIVYGKNDYDEERFHQFKPRMAHQVFGENENIFGYRSLSITLNYLHNSSRCFVDIKSSGAVQNENTTPDNIMDSLNSWLPENFADNKEDFKTMIENEKHDTIFGTELSEFEDKEQCSLFSRNAVPVKYRITSCDLTDEEFKEHHRRFETYIVWFIDAANFIDLEDERWLIFYVYEEFEHPEEKRKYVSPVGYCSVYKFFAYPKNVRARISQFFVLPSHQKHGIGKQLYHTVVKQLRELPEVVDVTVEEPTIVFQKIRDLDDCQTVKKVLEEKNINIVTGSQKVIFNELKRLKICKKQSQRIVDILRCYKASEVNGEEYRKYVDNIKSRIRAEVERETHTSKRMVLSPEAMAMVAQVDKVSLTEDNYTKYMADIEPSLRYLQKHS